MPKIAVLYPPRAVPAVAAGSTNVHRQQLEDIIERALALLDAMDGDVDMEPDVDGLLRDLDDQAPTLLHGPGDPDDGEAPLGWVPPYWEQQTWHRIARSGSRTRRAA